MNQWINHCVDDTVRYKQVTFIWESALNDKWFFFCIFKIQNRTQSTNPKQISLIKSCKFNINIYHWSCILKFIQFSADHVAENSLSYTLLSSSVKWVKEYITNKVATRIKWANICKVVTLVPSKNSNSTYHYSS